VGRVVDRDSRAKGAIRRGEIITSSERQAEGGYPVFVDGTSLDASMRRGENFGEHGMLADVNRRDDLASWW